MKPFTVIGTHERHNQIVGHRVMADSGLNAFAVAAALYPRMQFVVALAGHIDDKNVTFPGTAVVDAETVLDQPDVFGDPWQALPTVGIR